MKHVPLEDLIHYYDQYGSFITQANLQRQLLNNIGILITPQSTKDSLISSLTRRAYDICSPQHLPRELEHILTVLLDNGYPFSRIELVMRRTKHSIDYPASAPIQSDKQSAKVFIPYYPHSRIIFKNNKKRNIVASQMFCGYPKKTKKNV